jgi:hypothetical protein
MSGERKVGFYSLYPGEGSPAAAGVPRDRPPSGADRHRPDRSELRVQGRAHFDDRREKVEPTGTDDTYPAGSLA